MARLISLTIGIVLLIPIAAAAYISGPARVVDGDTIAIGDERIRFDGIDAPEGRQHCEHQGDPWECGAAARDALEELIGGDEVECRGNNRDRYGRLIARCYLGEVEINAWLVRHGWALDWPRYSDGRYAADQAEAQTDRRGVWRGRFDPPWEWRRKH